MRVLARYSRYRDIDGYLTEEVEMHRPLYGLVFVLPRVYINIVNPGTDTSII